MNKVAKNATWIIVCRVFQAVFALIINMLTARYLGPANFGLITYAASLVAFFVPVMQLGFSDILVQEIVRSPNLEGKILGTTMLLSLFSSIGCIIGVTTFALIANHDEPVTILVCFLYSILLLFQALDLIQYWFQAKYLSKYTAIVSLCSYVIVSAYKIYLLVTEKSVYWFAVSNAFDYMLISISIIVIYRRLGGQRFVFSKYLGIEMFNRSKHYILSNMMVTIFAQTDKIMIKLLLDETETGFYGAAVACAGMTSFVFVAIIDSFRPYIFEAQTTDDEKAYNHRLTMLYSIVIYMSLAQSATMTLLAKFIIRVLYGSAYMPAVGALQIIVWYTTFSYLGAVRNIWILSHGKQHLLWKINLMGASANVILNAFFIPLLGIYGAAIASLITQFFTNVIVGFILKPLRPNNSIIIRSINPIYFTSAIKKIIKR